MDLSITLCTEQYWEYVRLLRTNPRVSSGFISNSEITKEQQVQYMKVHGCNHRIVLLKNDPVGYFGVIDGDIRVCIHPDFQNVGVGKFAINECMKIWPNAYAKIKKENINSIKLFESCGFNLKYLIFEKEKIK